MPELVLLRHGQSQWNADNLFTGWHDVDLTDLGESEAADGGPAVGRRGGHRPRPADSPHLPAHPGHPHRRDQPGRRREDLAAGPPPLAAQRAPLRRPPGTRQEGDHRPPRGGPGQGVAPELRHPAAAGGARAPSTTRPATPATATCPPTPFRSPNAWPTWWPGSFPTGRTPSCPTCWPRGRGAGRCWWWPTATASAPSASTSTGSTTTRSSISRSPPASPSATELADDLTVVSSGYLGDPEAARAAAEAVRRQAG